MGLPAENKCKNGLTIPLPRSLPLAAGLGPFLKATITLANGHEAKVSKPAGDLGTPEAVRLYDETACRLLSGVKPCLAAHDLHPDFHSTRYAQSTGLPLLPVQHHHAHIAAVAAENGHEGPLIGLALDGFGLGPSGESWGGELLLVDGHQYTRLGGLAPLPQPGGDKAAAEPWRMGASALHVLGRGSEIESRFKEHPLALPLSRMLDKNVNCPPTSSCGRLFDAACGLLGVCPVSSFEGQAPMALESMAKAPIVLDGGWFIEGKELNMTPLLRKLTHCEHGEGANLFHGTLAGALADFACRGARQTGIGVIGLSGGCFLNRVLTKLLVPALAKQGLRVLTHHLLPPGDQCISLGQAWIAGLKAMKG